MNMFLLLVGRDLRRNVRGGGAVLPLAFFLIVATLFPFAIGPDQHLIAAIGGGALWIAALLASLLPTDRLLAPDMEAGVLDQLATRRVSEEVVATAKIAAHWLSFGPSLLLAAIPAAGLLRLDGLTLGRLEAGLALGSPALAALAVATAALTLGLRGAAALASMVLMPFALPVLIFGAAATNAGNDGSLRLLAAASLLLLVGAPFVAGAAMRAVRT